MAHPDSVLSGYALPASYEPRPYLTEGLTIRGHEFRWGSRTYLMGIVNATPDSFSGDGVGTDVEAAVALAKKMEADGADWLDIGGESSRPGAKELDPAEEARRVVPVIEAVRAATTLPISVDTYHASVARAGLAAGADAVNDIWGLRHDPEMARVVAESGAILIAMHNQRGREPGYPLTAIRAGFNESLRICAEHGIDPERVILDPGFGFGWSPEENLSIIRSLVQLMHFRLPLLIGTSRKSTIGHILGGIPVEQRLIGTAATVALSIASGADIVRVHDVGEMAQVTRVTDAVISRGHFGRVERKVTIALGSNLGDRLGNLRAAVDRIEGEHHFRIIAKSSVWETAPVPADQPPFLNAVVTAWTWRSPGDVLRALKQIEHDLGRRPERRWGPRPIDMDLLFHGAEAVDLPELQVPHPRILERNFVLAPLAEVMEGRLPILDVTATEALAKTGSGGLRRFSEL